MILPRDWPPYLSPPWLAAYVAGLGTWLALYAVGGWTLVLVIAGLGSCAVARFLWWLHTWRDREGRRTLRRWRAEAGLGGDES